MSSKDTIELILLYRIAINIYLKLQSIQTSFTFSRKHNNYVISHNLRFELLHF